MILDIENFSLDPSLIAQNSKLHDVFYEKPIYSIIKYQRLF